MATKTLGGVAPTRNIPINVLNTSKDILLKREHPETRTDKDKEAMLDAQERRLKKQQKRHKINNSN